MWASAEPIPFENLPTTEPFSSLMLKNFNLTEGDGRCVSRWTALLAACNGRDNLFGFARLQADAQGTPVLNFGELKRAGTKVTLVLQDEQARPILVNDNRVSAKLSLQESDIAPIYTPEGETQGILFLDYLKDIKTLQADEAINPACFGWAAYSVNQNMTFSLGAMSNADGTVEYYGDQNITLTTLVRPTPTHTKDGDSFTLIENPQFTDAEVLTITVNTDPDGADGLLITGTYTLKLKDVKVTENGQQKPLTAMKSGEHLTLTVTLAHNMKVSATATIGDWDQVSADVDLNDDAAKIPSYTYDAATHTYTIKFKRGIADVWVDMQQHTDRADAKVMYGIVELKYVNGVAMGVIDGNTSTEAISSVINAAIAADIKNYYVINELLRSDNNKPTLFEPIHSLVGIDEGGGPVSDDPDIGTLSIVLADVTQIQEWDFVECHALKSVSAPKATSIGLESFINCSGIEKVTLDVATTIGERAFPNCVNLTELTFGSVITEIDPSAFHKSGNGATPWTESCNLTLAAGQKDHAVYPVTAVGGQLKWAGYAWKSITVGDTEYAAVGDELYTAIDGVPVRNIDGTDYALIDGMCGKTTGHTADDEAPVIEQITRAIGAGINNFCVINELAKYRISPNYYVYNTVVGQAFINCGAADGSITLMFADATQVPDGAFEDCKNLKSVSAPNATSIYDDAFSGCSNITSINLPVATYISDWAFSGCSNITSINLPAATRIRDYAFFGCLNITSIDLPAAIYIGNHGFENCKSLTNLSLPLVTSIGDYAFQSCESITNLSLPLVTSIGNWTLNNCSKLATLSFGYVIVSVGNDPFQGVGSSVGGCDLTLASGQQHMTNGAPNGNPVIAADASATWVIRTWKSITISNNQ